VNVFFSSWNRGLSTGPDHGDRVLHADLLPSHTSAMQGVGQAARLPPKDIGVQDMNKGSAQLQLHGECGHSHKCMKDMDRACISEVGIK
jgi:hypothetical protein